MSESCPFCEVDEAILSNNLAFVIRDLFPVSPGHTLVVSRRHVADWFDLTVHEQCAILELANAARSLLVHERSPDGFNLGVNVCTAAGQTIAHAHLHLIPRYHGDVRAPRGGVRGVIAEKQAY